MQLALFLGLKRLKGPSGKDRPFVSVIVAARNEQHHLQLLLDSLMNQTYPDYEVIIVNDRSTDATRDIVEANQRVQERLKLVNITFLPVDLPPKKNALKVGILASKGHILCFTDADCIPTANWIATLVSYFDSQTGLVAGYSPYDASLLPAGQQSGALAGLLHRFVAAEEIKGALWSAGSIGFEMAWLCTGRNLAYRRRVFDEVGGYGAIKKSVSGDDDLFIQLVRRRTRWKIRYAIAAESFVRTSPPATFGEFVQQRTRHFSAGKFFTLPMKVFFAVFHASNLTIFLGLFSVFLSIEMLLPAAVAIVLKTAADYLLFSEGRKRFTASNASSLVRPLNFLLTEILYILYNTCIGPLGFVKDFEWKPEKRT
ncbi:MAG TPA: glycosyltransferase [Bacteroidota bacterium]